jgi:inorganic pyrophosphatase
MMNDYWNFLDRLVSESRIVLDRPKGSHHPRYSELVYPLDYGYLDGTTAADGGGIDIWSGSLPDRSLTGVIVTVDLFKRDTEIKILLGCTEEEVETVLDFHNGNSMRATLIRRPDEKGGVK